MIRILHIADVHLDTTFAGRPEHRRILQAACRDAFSAGVDAAIEHRVAAVLVAGDLFDNDRLTLETELFLLEQLRRLHEHGIPCVYVSGNHDPGGSSYRANQIDWPATFHFVKGKRVETIVIDDADARPLLRVSAAGHINSAVSDNLAASFPEKEGRIPHVGLLHTMVQAATGADNHDRYAPCSVADLQATGYDYWALGHIHLRQQVCDRSHAWYAGNLVGRNPRETGPKGGNLVTLEPGRPPVVEFVPFSQLQWATIDMDDLTDCTTGPRLVSHILASVDRLTQAYPEVGTWFVRINLRGPCPLVDRLRDPNEVQTLQERVATERGLAWVDVRTRDLIAPIDVDQYRGQPHIMSSVLDILDDLKQRTSFSADETAIPEAWANDPEPAYIHELLTDLDAVIAERFVVTGSK